MGRDTALCPAVHVSSGPVLGVETAAIHRAVVVVSVKMLETEGIGVIRHQLIIGNVIAEVQASHLSGRKGGAVAPVLKLIVIDVGNVSDFLFVIDICGIVGIIDCDEGGRILYVDQVVFICAVVDGDIITAVVLVVVEVILGVVVLVEGSIVVIVGGIVIIPGLEIGAVGVIVRDIIGGVAVQEVRKFDIRFVIVGCGGVIGVVNGIEGFVIAVNDLGIGGVPAPVVVGHVAVLVLHAAGGRGVVLLRYIDIPHASNRVYWIPHTCILPTKASKPILYGRRSQI